MSEALHTEGANLSDVEECICVKSERAQQGGKSFHSGTRLRGCLISMLHGQLKRDLAGDRL